MTSPRPDVRLEAAPMEPVTCTACGAGVTARKSSWDQTTLQWTADALERCTQRRATEARSDRPNRSAFPGCTSVRDSIREAAVRGELSVQSDEPLKTNPAQEADR
ncbi:ferredoxin [Nocardioides sp. zg-578]|nr:ferredoxin [Nocardioides marmotae]MTB83053.1 ferredoxin [Nocardioides marmotae]